MATESAPAIGFNANFAHNLYVQLKLGNFKSFPAIVCARFLRGEHATSFRSDSFQLAIKKENEVVCIPISSARWSFFDAEA